MTMGLVVVGAAGRMGRTLIRAVHETPGASLVGAVEREGSPFIGQDAGILAGVEPLDVTISDDPLPVFARADGVLDFTIPSATTQESSDSMAARRAMVMASGMTLPMEATDSSGI